MATVRVYNRNKFPYKEKFKDEHILIAPGAFIEMDEDDAHMFKGSFSSPVLGVNGEHLPEGFKMIEIVRGADVKDEAPKAKAHQCLACKYTGSSEGDLNEHLKIHQDQVVVDEEAEKAIRRKRA
jgi:hypothetical protein